MEVPIWVTIILGLLLLLYIFTTWKHGYFIKYKLPFRKPIPIFGNMAPFMLRQTSIADFMLDYYNEFEGYKICGLFDFGTPCIMVRDPEILKQITVKDFEYFTDHNIPVTEHDIFSKNLISLKGERWKNMRHLLSPTFTSSKMKNMFMLILKCGEQMGEYLEKKCRAADDGVVRLEMKDFYTKYTNDVIATAAFGVHVDSLEQPDNEFYEMGKAATNFNMIVFFIFSVAPKLAQKLGMEFFPAKVMNFFRNLVHGTIATREKEGIVRPDMIHLLMQARKETKNATLTNDDIAAQAFLFFFAGFDTASTLLCFMTHLLATHPDVQQRLRAEIDEVLAQHNGEINYEGMQQLKYMEAVMSETLRLHPPGVTSDRVCVKPYTIQATDTSPEFKVNVGDVISLPTIGFHRDPKYFLDPERFDPERFSDDNKGNINPFAYFPFGVGPRNCIGMRFAQMEAKIAMTSLVSRFHLRVIDKTTNPIKYDKTKFNLTVVGGFWLGLELRTDKSE